jgi:hypothetical protein
LFNNYCLQIVHLFQPVDNQSPRQPVSVVKVPTKLQLARPYFKQPSDGTATMLAAAVDSSGLRIVMDIVPTEHALNGL